MSTASAGASGGAAAGSERKWGRRLLTFAAAALTLLLVVIVAGVFIPSTNLVSVIGTVFESFFTVHIFLAGLVAIALALWARSLGGRTAVTVILWLAILATIGSTIPMASRSQAARTAPKP